MMIRKLGKRWTLGLVMLALVIVLWVLSSFLLNLIFQDNSYKKPFFITYINTASFVFYLIPTGRKMVKNYIQTGHFHAHDELVLEEEGAAQDVVESEQDPDTSITVHSPLIPKDSNVDHDGSRLSLPETMKLSAEFCVLWFTANFVTNASLAYTSVASQTILSSTSSFFTLFVGALCHTETLNRVNIVGSIVSFLGILLVTRSDALQSHIHIKPFPGSSTFDDNDDTSADAMKTLLGNVLALLGAFFYGIYSTLLKHRIKDESRVNMKIFFGFVGLFTLIFVWPTLLLLHYTGWESFELPSTPRIITVVTVNCLITFISDFCWANAMLLTSPLTVTVGLSITIPFAMFGDFMLKNKPMTLLYFLGAMLILGSFFIINKHSEEETLDHLLEDTNSSATGELTV